MSGPFHKGSARMFESEWLEKLSHVHPATPAVLFLPVVAFSLYLAVGPRQHAGGRTSRWQVRGRLLGWTLIEYWFHRLFFHLPVRGKRQPSGSTSSCTACTTTGRGTAAAW